MGRVKEIWTTPDKGLPMQSHRFIAAIAGQGLAGDRYALGTGAYSKEKKQVRRDVTLIETEVLAAIAAEGGPTILTSQTRRNLVTEGIKLNELIGQRLMLGENGPIIRGVELCEPCDRPGKLSGDTRLMKEFKDQLMGRGGLRAEILTSGLIALNTPIIVLAD